MNEKEEKFLDMYEKLSVEFETFYTSTAFTGDDEFFKSEICKMVMGTYCKLCDIEEKLDKVLKGVV